MPTKKQDSEMNGNEDESSEDDEDDDEDDGLYEVEEILGKRKRQVSHHMTFHDITSHNASHHILVTSHTQHNTITPSHYHFSHAHHHKPHHHTTPSHHKFCSGEGAIPYQVERLWRRGKFVGVPRKSVLRKAHPTIRTDPEPQSKPQRPITRKTSRLPFKWCVHVACSTYHCTTL